MTNAGEINTDPDFLRSLYARKSVIRADWDRSQPFHYVVVDDFLPPDFATTLHGQFPSWDVDGWDATEYLHQRRKLTRTHGFEPDLEGFFRAIESRPFLDLVTEFTGIRELVPDPARIGGGCHQILPGGFLDVHVDFNRHPEMRLRRRLNLLLYLNPGWDDSWGGQLELWDREANQPVEEVQPIFNRAVLFETGEKSFHGHPVPLRTPPGVSRKSLAFYFYTEDDPDGGPEHNTIYVATTGVKGYLKTASAAGATAKRYVEERGVRGLASRVVNQAVRLVRREPPPND